METQFVEIDGNKFQGGGQMIRSSIVLAVLLDRPVKIHSIRAGRPNPGINNQLRAILSPFMEKPPPNGSQYLELIPKIPKMEKISAGTSASCTLMMQCLLPIAVFTGYEGQTVLEGGTDVSNSPPSRIIKDVFTKLIAKMGIQLNINKIKPGYYPKGGGSIQYKVQVDKQVHGIDLLIFTPPTEGIVRYYRTKNNLPQDSNDLKKQIKSMMRKSFGQQLMLDLDIGVQSVRNTKTQDYGISLLLTNENVIWDCGIVGKQAKNQDILQKLRVQIQSKASLDDYHQDQLIIYMALAHGTSRMNIGPHQSNHTKSMIYILKSFIPDIKITHQDNILTIQGISYKYSSKQ